MNRRLRESGLTNIWLTIGITAIGTTVIVAGVMIWALINYFDQKDNVDTKVAVAVASAKKEQGDADAANFEKQYKLPTNAFSGPEDYGSVAFSFPRTWSVFVNKDGSTGDTYEAYLNPGSVPPIKSTQQYALRVTIENKSYDQVLTSYDALVKKGDLKSSAVKSGDQNGTRLDGAFTKDIRGSAVIFKIRDKTLTIRTDADTFRADFDALVATITFKQ